MVNEIGAIIGGCTAGGLVFLFIIGIIVYQVVSKRKHRKRHDQSKFRPITPQTSPTHSQPSTLGNDGRLPKVNSTGLWVGAPSMYTGAAPSPAYYYGPGKMSSKQAPPHPGMIPKASSETRIPNSGLHYTSSRPMYGSHGNLIIMPVVGIQPRIYHSSQPLAPVFEVPPHASPSAGLEIYDVYQFGGGNSRSKLVEETHSKYYYDEMVMPNSKLARSQSDVQEIMSKKSSRHSRSRDSSSSSSKQGPKVSRSSSSSSRDRGLPSQPHRSRHGKNAPEPPRPSSSSVILQQHNRSNSRESRPSSSSPGYRIGMKSKSLDSLDDNLSRSSFGGGNYNKAFDPGFGGGRLSSVSGEIILMPANPVPSKVKVVAAVPYGTPSSTPRSNIMPNGAISGNVSGLNTGFPDRAGNGVVIMGEHDAQIDTSATDSMKLLAKNKTDDQKTVVVVGKSASPPSSGINGEDNHDIIDIVEDMDLSRGHVHYSYQGDIYALPDKNTSPRDDLNENPIISRMKEMVVEKSRTNSTRSMSSRDYNEDLPSPRNNTPRSFNTTTSAGDIIIDNEYQEIGDIIKSMETINTNGDDVVDKHGVSISNGQMELPNGNLHEDVADSGILHSTNYKDFETSNSALVNGVDSHMNPHSNSNDLSSVTGDGSDNWVLADSSNGADTRVQSVPMSPVKTREHNPDSKVADTTFEEINNAGKRITASAFEFLNTYLSDDEGGDGQTSP